MDGINTHILGNRLYELTSHLGNVQAMVSDKRREATLPGNDTVDRYRPVLQAAYDYYPFGMLMPGRYTSDTSEQCAWVTTTKYVPTLDYEDYWPGWASGLANCGFVPVNDSPEPDFYIENAGTSEATLTMISSDQGTAIYNMIDVAPGVEQELYTEAAEATEECEHTIIIDQEVNGEWEFLTNAVVRMSDPIIHLYFTPEGTQVRMRIVRTDGLGVQGFMRLKPVMKLKYNYVPQNVLTYVCNRAKDN